jgi:methionyl-tRNA formyltransferase
MAEETAESPKRRLRVLFMGTPEFAVASLEKILEHGYTVPLVVTTPDRAKGRGLRLTPSAVKEAATRHNIPVLTPERMKDPDVAQAIRQANADIICVVAFRILPESVFTIPRLGSFNLHGSLLPKYRGAAPINWAIINGDTETGVTTFFLKQKVDTGNVIVRRAIPITPEMTAGQLHDVMMHVGAAAVVDTLRMIEQGAANPLPQDDQQATPAPKIFRNDCQVDWGRPAESVHNFIRGLSPHPGAFMLHNGRTLKLFRSQLTDRTDIPAGVIRIQPSALLIGTGTVALSITELQQEGKRAMGVEEFLRGYQAGK